MFLNLSVILFTEGGGTSFPACTGKGLASQHALGKGSWFPSMHWEGRSVSGERRSTFRGLASGKGAWADPLRYGILWDMVNEWAVCILLECILVFYKIAYE